MDFPIHGKRDLRFKESESATSRKPDTSGDAEFVRRLQDLEESKNKSPTVMLSLLDDYKEKMS